MDYYDNEDAGDCRAFNNADYEAELNGEAQELLDSVTPYDDPEEAIYELRAMPLTSVVNRAIELFEKEWGWS